MKSLVFRSTSPMGYRSGPIPRVSSASCTSWCKGRRFPATPALPGVRGRAGLSSQTDGAIIDHGKTLPHPAYGVYPHNSLFWLQTTKPGGFPRLLMPTAVTVGATIDGFCPYSCHRLAQPFKTAMTPPGCQDPVYHILLLLFSLWGCRQCAVPIIDLLLH